MVILPAQLALKSGTEGQIGVLEKADTNTPEFVVETAEVCGLQQRLSFLLISTLLHLCFNTIYCREHFDFLGSLCLLRQHSLQSFVNQSVIRAHVRIFLTLHLSSQRLVNKL